MEQTKEKVNHKLAARRGQRDVLDPRRHCVSVRLSEAELARLDAKRGRWARGEWLRMAFLDKLNPQLPNLNAQAYSELARSASNLNQIAKHLNESGGREVLEAEIQKIIHALHDFRVSLIAADRATFRDSGEAQH